MVSKCLVPLPINTTEHVYRGCCRDQAVCTCADPFSMACPLHISPESDSGPGREGVVAGVNKEQDRLLGTEGDGTRVVFQGPLCDCQVFSSSDKFLVLLAAALIFYWENVLCF